LVGSGRGNSTDSFDEVDMLVRSPTTNFDPSSLPWSIGLRNSVHTDVSWYNDAIAREAEWNRRWFQGLGDITDVSTWDWHEWALAGIVAYFVVSRVFRSGRKAVKAVEGYGSKRRAKKKRIRDLEDQLKEARGGFF
jgi:hypothetical protein